MTVNDNNNGNPNRIIFTTKDTKLYITVVTLSVKDNQILSEILSKEFERSVYWIEYETKSEDKNMKNQYRYFVESNIVGANRLFALVYLNRDNYVKRYIVQRNGLPKATIENFGVIINETNFNDQYIDSDIKEFEEIRKLKTGQGKDYTTGSFFGLWNHYKLIIAKESMFVLINLEEIKEQEKQVLN